MEQRKTKLSLPYTGLNLWIFLAMVIGVGIGYFVPIVTGAFRA